MVSSDVYLNFSSTLEDSLLTFQCKDGLLPEGVFTSRCYRNGSWILNPSNHICGNSTSGTMIKVNWLISSISIYQWLNWLQNYACMVIIRRIMHIIIYGCDAYNYDIVFEWTLFTNILAVGSNKNYLIMNYLIIPLGCSFGIILVLLVVVTVIYALAITAKKG